jgi:predicted lactoylglutathione lyase
MVFSTPIYVMLLTHDKYRQFTAKKIADAKATSQVLICLSADSRDAVDDMVGKAQGAGGGADPARSRITASCTAAVSKIPTVTTGK